MIPKPNYKVRMTNKPYLKWGKWLKPRSWNQQLCMTRSEDSPMILAGNLIFHNNNTVFVLAFFQFMDFSSIYSSRNLVMQILPDLLGVVVIHLLVWILWLLVVQGFYNEYWLLLHCNVPSILNDKFQFSNKIFHQIFDF